MKAIILSTFIVAIIGAVLGFPNLRDGRPACSTDKEIQQSKYPNFWDATAYWVCVTKGVPATLKRCDEGYGYQASLKKCVDWDDWEWEDPVPPPSSVYNN